ncbi:MAG: hypothetical protein ACXV0U_07985 [Kineosporiaceae bacterium]|jgi:hypothetical protein
MSESDLPIEMDPADVEITPDDEPGIEAPEADAVEQHTEAFDRQERQDDELPVEVDPADRTEQERIVDLGEDDYR